MINSDERIPDVAVQYMQDGAVVNTTTHALFADKKVVLFAVPGAFTPTCSQAHLPGYVVHYDEFVSKGVDLVVCMSVNDAFVMDAWGKASNAENILMLADGGAAFSKALGLEMETGDFGGVRARRFAMVLQNNTATTVNVEAPKAFEVSNAETMLKAV